MKFIFDLTLVVCLFDLTVVAARLRENLNVLVPTNDVNLHAKIKTYLSGDEQVDPEDFSDTEIETLSEMNDPDIVKLRQKSTKHAFEETPTSSSEKSVREDSNHLKDPHVILPMQAYSDPSDAFRPPIIDVNESPVELVGSQNTPTLIAPSPSPEFPPFPMINSTTENWNNVTLPQPTINTTVISTTSKWETGNQTDPFYNTTIQGVTDPTIPDTPEVISTTISPDLGESNSYECLLGRAGRYLPWLNYEGGLNVNYIISEFGYVNYLDLSRKFGNITDYVDFIRKFNFNGTLNLRLLSASHNNLSRLPTELLQDNNGTLEYLSLPGNRFKSIPRFTNLPMLKTLDLRSSGVEVLLKDAFVALPRLQSLFLADNHLSLLTGDLFPPSLIHLDLSFNSDILKPEGIYLEDPTFIGLERLQRLDLSFTQLHETKRLTALMLLRNLEELSLCSTDLPGNSEIEFNTLRRLKYLDISGNARFILKEHMFTNLSDSLQVLFAKNSLRQNLDWTKPLRSLRILDLYNSNIHEVKSDSFSHMTYLTTLNLEKNAIGNWYSKLFADNQHLETLNLRDNKLTLLTEDMKEDFMSVKFLAIGKNDFECSCVLQEFMEVLFTATKAGNVTRYLEDKTDDFTDTTRVSLVVRNYLRPEYDVMSRTYQKYYQMAAQSVQAMKMRTTITSSTATSRKLIMMTNAIEGRLYESDLQTILFDYDEDYDDYTCWNATGKQLQQIIVLNDLCEKQRSEDPEDPPYKGETRTRVMSFWISLSTVIIVSALLLVTYWKWWYIKYFFVLCKNSAILTFMDDDNDKDAIIKGRNSETVEVFLYDAFVSYCEQNREWVLDEFIPNIEKRESINVCLHERDFQVGYGILENIVSCMDRSRCLVLLISENFLLSQWCQFEMNLAQHRLIETRREKLILVLLEDIPVKKQPKTLKYLMRTKTYIKWPQGGSNDEKSLFWKRLKKAIISSKWENDSYGSIV